MPIRNSDSQWGWLSIGLHWLTLLLIVGLALVGLLMTELPTGRFKIAVYAMHKSFGLTVLALTILRLLWRFFSAPPLPDASTPRWQHLLAQGMHLALYGLLLLVPFFGWLFNSAAGFPLRWFGLFSVPRLSHFDPNLKAFAREMHENLFFALALLIALHAAAALWHHYRIRDAILTRMAPWWKR